MYEKSPLLVRVAGAVAGLSLVGAIAYRVSFPNTPPEPERDKSFNPAGVEIRARQLCDHLTSLGCEQRTECAKERAYHLSDPKRDMREECLMSAQSPHDVLACGTATCQPPSPSSAQ